MLVDEILQMFQTSLQEVIAVSKSHKKEFGWPPEEMIVSEHLPSENHRFNTGSRLRSWKISAENIEAIEVLKEIPDRKVNGMYYSIAIGDFSFIKEKELVRVGWIVGPRYGRGFDFKITDTSHLGNRTPKWTS